MSRKKGQVFSADYYYTKALDYLSSFDEDSSATPTACPCLCGSSDGDDSNFSLGGFRPGLPQDEGNPSRRSSYSGSSSSDLPCEGEAAKTGSDEGRSEARAKRKLSDGHVHWADEFRKELTRCNPRKSYTRHPSLHQLQVKPILKATTEDSTSQGDPDPIR